MKRRYTYYILLILAFAALSGGLTASTALGAPAETPEELARLKRDYAKYHAKLVRWRKFIPIMEADLERAYKSRAISHKKRVDLGARLNRIAAKTIDLSVTEIEKTKRDYKKYKAKLKHWRRFLPGMKTDLERAYKSRAISRKKCGDLSKQIAKSTRKEIGVGLPQASGLPALEKKLDRRFGIFLTYQSLAEDFNTALAERLWQRGTKLQIAWEPHDPAKSPSNQPEYSLKTIINGNHDAAIRRWARQIKAFSRPVYFRPISEMNSDWVAWGAHTNGNRPEEYIPAWRRIRKIFQEVGATNARFIWSPNRAGDEAEAKRIFEQFYPGSAYVDYVGINGYNWGRMYETPAWTSSWMSFSTVFGPSYRVAVRRTSKPIFIAETATTEIGGSKATWIKNTFKEVRDNYPRIKAIVWFNFDKETDWRIDNNVTNLEAFRKYAFN